MGNDFLPTPLAFMKSVDPEYNVINEFISVYKETMELVKIPIIQDGEIDLYRFAVFIDRLSAREKGMIERMSANRRSSPIFNDHLLYVSHNYNPKQGVDQSGAKFQDEEAYAYFINSWRKQERSANQNIAGIKKMDLKDIGLNSGEAFIIGMYWIYSYYKTGRASNSWVYEYVYAPMIADMEILIDIEDPGYKAELEEKIKSIVSPTRNAPIIEIPRLLFTIIPANVKGGISEAISSKITEYATYKDKSKFVPTIDYYGLEKTESHVLAVNLPIMKRIYNPKKKRWVFAKVPEEIDDYLYKLGLNSTPESTMFTERKEVSINLATMEKRKYDEEQANYKLSRSEQPAARSAAAAPSSVGAPRTSTTRRVARPTTTRTESK